VKLREIVGNLQTVCQSKQKAYRWSALAKRYLIRSVSAVQRRKVRLKGAERKNDQKTEKSSRDYLIPSAALGTGYNGQGVENREGREKMHASTKGGGSKSKNRRQERLSAAMRVGTRSNPTYYKDGSLKAIPRINPLGTLPPLEGAVAGTSLEGGGGLWLGKERGWTKADDENPIS